MLFLNRVYSGIGKIQWLNRPGLRQNVIERFGLALGDWVATGLLEAKDETVKSIYIPTTVGFIQYLEMYMNRILSFIEKFNSNINESILKG